MRKFKIGDKVVYRDVKIDGVFDEGDELYITGFTHDASEFDYMASKEEGVDRGSLVYESELNPIFPVKVGDRVTVEYAGDVSDFEVTGIREMVQLKSLDNINPSGELEMNDLIGRKPIVNAGPSTIEIEGKSYDLKEVQERLKELTPVKK